MVHNVLFSSATDEWETPQALFDRWNGQYAFTLDVCATAENAKCRRFFTRREDGLRQRWTGTCWMNPPYGRPIGLWVEKAYKSSRLGATVVCLLPARTDTAWWHEWVLGKGQVHFLRGRVRFVGGRHSAPFPSAIAVYTPPSGLPQRPWSADEEIQIWGEHRRAIFAPWLRDAGRGAPGDNDPAGSALLESVPE